MLNLVRHTNNSRKIIQDGYSLLLVSHVSELQKEDLSLLDGFIINTDSQIFIKEIIVSIRTNSDIKIALKPLFINSIYHLPKQTAIHLDGKVELSMISSYIQRILTITKRINSVEQPRLLSHDVLIQYKTLAYLHTRNTQLTAVQSRDSFIGYEFPFISLFYKKTEAISLLENLRKASEKNYLSFKLQDYIHLCKSCSGNYLNFRESCPQCDSIDIDAHDMIHHFVCAHVAPEKDFKKEEALECPKCDKHLRHIGIDYDKPSTIYSCNSCSHEFQNPGMLSLCVDCGTENKLEELLRKAIGNYAITQKGEQLLYQKNNTKMSKGIDHSEDIGSLDVNLFKILLNQEIKRVNVTKGDSFFATIKFQNNQLQLLNNSAKKGLRKEIAQIIKSYLNDTDILSSQSFNNYYLLLPETKENQLDRLELVEYNLSKLLSDNLKDEKQKIEIMIHKIKGTDLLQNYFL
ncbi:hypothetical protein AAON49_12580 [Pseudotenacibaculum sp. MALMAid0570]|uniref:TackOD1 domain-containing metal-binding protein n=1 Tax=Pseudotenacibaculum sp. MALMAid0570 TaxID=3143938 RepID=UPI0032DE35D1